MTDLNAEVDQYLQAAGLNTPPPPMESDPLVTGTTPIEQLLLILGLAANADDSEDYAEGLDEHARREVKTTEAAEKFAAQDQAAAAQVASVASGIAGALAGALGSALQPLAQIPQFGQALQAGMGMFGGPAPLRPRLSSEPLIDDFTSAADDFDPPADYSDSADDISPLGSLGVGGGFPSGPSGFGATAPTAALGAAPPPGVPSSAPSPPSPARVGVPAAPIHGVGGMPMVPPAVTSSAGADKPTKTDTKRVSVPTVRNGAPVQGRLTPGPIETSDGDRNRAGTVRHSRSRGDQTVTATYPPQSG